MHILKIAPTVSTCIYKCFQGRIQILESSITQQDDYYKQNMAEMSRIHKEQLQTFIKRMEDTEKTFLVFVRNALQ